MHGDTKRMMTMAIMGAIAFVLMWFAFPVIPVAPFLKIDFSDVPVLMTTFLYGPVSGIVVVIIRGILHYIQTGGDMGLPIGDSASILASIAFLWPVYQLMKERYFTPCTVQTKHHSAKRLLLAYGLATLALTVVMSVLNYFIITPFYVKVMQFPIPDMNRYILGAVIPFNLIKGIIISVACHLVLRYLLPILAHRLNKA
ncbi:MAG: ECF transporter S component [Aerococcus sp.]|nr:ECF transporter S component [Aerococcus sp.]